MGSDKMKGHKKLGKWLAASIVTALLAVSVLLLLSPITAGAAAPNRPSNLSPANGTYSISLTHTFLSSSDPSATHAASQWQITTKSGDYSSPVFDSGTDSSNLTSITIPSGSLSYNTTYYWHVRYQDSHDNWSAYSRETSFATEEGPKTSFSATPSAPSAGLPWHWIALGTVVTGGLGLVVVTRRS